MSETSAVQLNRIVQLVAELTRYAGPDEPGVPVATLADRLGTTPAQVQRDVRTLTAASDDPDGEWLQSLSVWQEGDRVSVSSRGPFRRPVRLTPDELLAIRVGLALEGQDAAPLLEALAGLKAAPGRAGSGAPAESVVELATTAVAESRLLTILYAGERDFAGAPRTIEPHQVVAADGGWYVVAWCRRAHGWRHFRADRVIDAMLEDASFTPRPDHVALTQPGDVFRAGEDAPQDVRVRFKAAVARWLAERWPGAERLADGAVVVRYEVADPHWLVRHVLQYGDDAEVLGPPEFRTMMRRAVG